MVLAETPHRFYSTQAGADIEFDLPAPRLEDEPENE